MTETKQKFPAFLKVIVPFGLVLGAVYWVVQDPGVNAEGSARTARLEELKAQLGLVRTNRLEVGRAVS